MGKTIGDIAGKTDQLFRNAVDCPDIATDNDPKMLGEFEIGSVLRQELYKRLDGDQRILNFMCHTAHDFIQEIELISAPAFFIEQFLESQVVKDHDTARDFPVLIENLIGV